MNRLSFPAPSPFSRCLLAGSLFLHPNVAAAQTAPVSATGVTHLRCEYLVNPLTVDAAKPRLSWTIESSRRGWMQSAYRVQVASSFDALVKGRADLWDSGKMLSDRTLNVRYAGKPLGSGERVFWRVQVWDNKGIVSPWSAPQSWGMGLLRPGDWKSQWISAPASPATANGVISPPRPTVINGIVLGPAPLLRKTFDLAKPVYRATLFSTAHGVYEMRLNGARVGDGLLAPGWTDYDARLPYQAHDVTALVRRGANALGAMLGDGWYSGYVGFGRRRDHYGRTPALRAQLDVEFTDGTRQIIGSDSSWQGMVENSPIVYSDLLMGENYDARREQTGWDTPQATTTNWHPVSLAPAVENIWTVDVTAQVQAAVKDDSLTLLASNALAGDPAYNTVKGLKVEYTVGGARQTRTIKENETLQIPTAGAPKGPLKILSATFGDLEGAQKAAAREPATLVGTRDPVVRVTQELKPVKITQPTPGAFLFDMGQNMVGVARLKVQGPAGTTVKMRFAEMLNPDGSAYTANLRGALATDTYVCKGGGLETWEPHFTFHGFRYIEVTGFPGTPTLDAITGLVIGSDIALTGTFSCSSPLVNQLQSNIDWGQRGNFLSVPTDCPQRDERLGWMGDAQVFVRTATYNRDVSAFFEKWLQDVEDAQAPDGGFSDVSPRKVDEANGAPAWADAGIIVPWTVYEAYDDPAVIDEHWDAMTRYLDYLTSANPNGLWQNKRANDFGDWLSIGADTPKDVLATAYYANDAALMAKMARATGRSAEAAEYDALFNHIKGAFNSAFVTSDGKVKGDTQTCYLLALHFDLLPQTLRPLAAGHLAANIAAKNNHLSTGFIGVGYLCPVLSDTGQNDLAYKLLLNDTFPSWGFSIRQGATTIWERWDGWTPDKGFQSVGMNSFNHYSLGSVGEWLYSHVAGIATAPDAPGFKRIVIQPQPGAGLTFANATFDSVRGRVVSNWKRERKALTLNVTIPANTTATVCIPTPGAAGVRESGKPIKAAPGVRFVRQDGADAVFEVGSGTYTFTAPTG